MALKSTVYRVTLTVNDTYKHHYHTYNFKIACHPSETEGRMCLRLVAFALFAGDKLAFTRGLSATDEPDIWQKDDTGLIERWIELGWPEEKRISKACGLASSVIVIAYGRQTNPWWESLGSKLQRFGRLTVIDTGESIIEQLTPLTSSNMELSVTIDEEVLWISSGEFTVELPLLYLKGER